MARGELLVDVEERVAACRVEVTVEKRGAAEDVIRAVTMKTRTLSVEDCVNRDPEERGGW